MKCENISPSKSSHAHGAAAAAAVTHTHDLRMYIVCAECMGWDCSTSNLNKVFVYKAVQLF